MKISYKWIKDLVAIPWSVDETAERLTLLGFLVDNVTHTGLSINNVVAAKILSVDKHPNADRLRIARVTDGTTEKSIVCGAPNIAPDQIVPLALPGAKLGGGLEIKISKIRGIESAGMLCSERELGLSESHEGIMMLPASAKLGQEVKDIIGGQDTVFAIDIAPNRPDCLSHIGIARELAAASGKPLKLAKNPYRPNAKGNPCRISIKSPQNCYRYMGKIFEQVKVGISPRWMAERLTVCGIRPINNIVDITNYVLLEWGHPLHAFDLDKLGGEEIVVRLAQSGETILALDGRTYNLTEQDLVIADNKEPVAIAGVMGGQNTGVTESTTRLLLESAVFNRISVRKTSKRLNLASESSYRFERGTDGWTAEQASLRAAQLIIELAAGVPGQAKDVYPKKDQKRTVGLTQERLNLVAGMDIPANKVETILKNLNLTPKKAKGGWVISAPSYRADLTEEFDVIEEVIRSTGYETIPTTLPSLRPTRIPESQKPLDTRPLADLLIGLGLNETICNTFSNIKLADVLQIPAESRILLGNPLSQEDSLLRPLISLNLLQSVTNNIHYQRNSVHLFEIGKRYEQQSRHSREGGNPDSRLTNKDGFPIKTFGNDATGANEFRENLCCGMVLYGPQTEKSWDTHPKPADFFTLKGVIDQIQGLIPNLNIQLTGTKPPFLHPNLSFVLVQNGQTVGWGGMLHPSLEPQFDLKAPLAVCEWVLSPVQTQHKAFRAFPKFPFVERDIAILVDKNVAWSAIEQAIQDTERTLLESVWPFDMFTGGTLDANKKSVAFRIRLRHPDHTLSDQEITQAVEKIKSRLTETCGAHLR